MLTKTAGEFQRGDKVSVVRKKDARDYWGRVELVKGDVARVAMRSEELGTRNYALAKLRHRCVVKGCPHPATAGKGTECIKCKGERVAMRPTGRMEEFPITTESRIDGNNQHSITWDPKQVNFHFTVRDKRMLLREDQNKDKALVRFYGWYRRNRLGDGSPCWSIDVFCKRNLDDGTEADVAVDTITYSEADPRGNIKSLNADLCAIAQRWLAMKVNGDVKTIDQLWAEAKTPAIKIHRIATIDQMIWKLKEMRDTAIRAGGARMLVLEGDVKGGAQVQVHVNVTAQAIALQGKPPSMHSGAIWDAARGSGRGERVAPINKTPSPENVKALQARLKETDDEAEKRKIRAVLRKMGHKGGGRGQVK